MTNIVIYSREACQYCDMAKNVLNVNNLEFTELKLNRDFNREEILELFPTAKTFPIIVVDGRYIGGYTQLIAEIDNSGSSLGKQVILG